MKNKEGIMLHEISTEARPPAISAMQSLESAVQSAAYASACALPPGHLLALATELKGVTGIFSDAVRRGVVAAGVDIAVEFGQAVMRHMGTDVNGIDEVQRELLAEIDEASRDVGA